MATAAKLATYPQQWCKRYGGLYSGAHCEMCDCELAPTRSVAEELALLTGAELFDASQETSRVYNGHVIAKAVVIVQIRIHCPSLPDLARRIGVSKSIVYRHAAAHPLSDAMLHRAIRDLAILLDEEGVRR